MRGALLFLLAVGVAFAQSLEGLTVTSVEVIGNERVASIAVLDQMKTKPGAPLSRGTLAEDIERIYATGYFEDVRVEAEETEGGLALKVYVRERPAIESLEIRGNRAIAERTIRAKMHSVEGEIYSPAVLAEDVEAVRAMYEERGYFMAAVRTEVTELPEARAVRVKLLIDEGPFAKVKRLWILGNEHLTDKQIRKVMKTRTSWLWRKVFRKEEFEADLERIVELYRDNGYLDARVVRHAVELAPNKKHLYVTIEIEEGRQYRVGSITLEGNTILSDEALARELYMRSGEPYSPAGQERNLDALYNAYARLGRIRTAVACDPLVDPQAGTVSLVYRITEGDEYRLGRIDISGNTTTRDKVIRREFGLEPGDVFDLERVRRGVERLNYLQYFEWVRTSIETRDHQADLGVEVEETKTGQFLFGVGYSSLEKVVGFFQIEQRNFDWRNWPRFVGGGQDLSLLVAVGGKSSDFEISFTEPWFRDTPNSLGFDLYHRTWDYSKYDEKRVGGRIRFRHPMSEFTKLALSYRLEEVTISDLEEDVSRRIAEEEGTFQTSSITVGLVRDTTDSAIMPTMGTTSEISLELAGGLLGGDRDFYKIGAKGAWYREIMDDWVFSLSGSVDYAQEYGDSDDVPIFERFFAGGTYTVRGYPFRDIGPKDEEGDPIGGKFRFLSTAEVTFPISGEVLRGAIFTDAGNVWEDAGDVDGDLALGSGVGLRMKTPLGPVRLDWAYGFDRKSGRLHFSMGRLF